MCGANACPNATYTGQCVLDESDPCSKCAAQCPYGYEKQSAPCSECKCLQPCTGVNCLPGLKCQEIAIDICGDEPCANTTYLGLCVPSANSCPVPCLHFCEFGFVLGSNGCPTCKCAKPCKNVTCEFGTKCKEVADRWCGSVACVNTTYSPKCDLCPPCNKYCPYGTYVGSDGCPSCDCLDPCRGSSCKDGLKCRPKASIMCGADACANATYYPECVAKTCPTCNNICAFGYKTDNDGCPTCVCNEPCKNAKCGAGLMCKEVADNMCGGVPCANSTYSGQCVAQQTQCMTCAVLCPYGNVIGLDGCPTCVCAEPCLNVRCNIGMKCVAQKRPLCGDVPCANATFVGVCYDEVVAANMTGVQTGNNDAWVDPLKDVTYLRHEVQVCSGDAETISCPDDHEIVIARAFYGRNSSTICLRGSGTFDLRFQHPQATSVVKTLCDDKQSCQLSPDLNVFGKPQAGVSLYLTATYYCQPLRHETLQCANTGRMRLECPAGSTLNIISAMYGRDDLNTTCPHPFAAVTNNCSNPLAFTTVKALCNGHRTCYVGADSQTFDDPCPHVNKYLRMEYECLDCSNSYGDDLKCQFWANQGECDNNKDWMLSNCRKACTRCELELPCTNGYLDKDCDSWAAAGECTSNPTFMYAYCRKSCLKCDRTTDCVNNYNDTACNVWMQQNQCSENAKFMLPTCTKSCFFCSGNIKCANNYADKDCDQWAINGECDKNPGFMVSQCYKSCFNCDKDPVCENSGASDSQCDAWAAADQCVKNPSFMYRYCWKSCIKCQAHQQACRNNWNDIWCEHIALNGQCSLNGALDVCYKSCSRCAPTPAVSDCYNTNDTLCNEMASRGECRSNPAKALQLCKLTCSMCDQPTIETAYSGGGLLPGELLNGVTGYTVLLPQEIKTQAKLAYFTAFFASNTSFYLQVWKFWYTDNYYLTHSQYVTPQAANYAQTIQVDKCVQLSAGDRIGFTTLQGPPPIATSFDPNMGSKNAYIRQASKTDKFTPVGLSVRFSLNAHYFEGRC